MKKFFAEFKEFAMRGNVMDMAVGFFADAGAVLGFLARPGLAAQHGSNRLFPLHLLLQILLLHLKLKD